MNRDKTHQRAILDTVATFLDTCSDLENVEDLTVGEPFDFDDGLRVEVTIDGVMYAVTVEPVDD